MPPTDEVCYRHDLKRALFQSGIDVNGDRTLDTIYNDDPNNRDVWCGSLPQRIRWAICYAAIARQVFSQNKYKDWS